MWGRGELLDHQVRSQGAADVSLKARAGESTHGAYLPTLSGLPDIAVADRADVAGNNLLLCPSTLSAGQGFEDERRFDESSTGLDNDLEDFTAAVLEQDAVGKPPTDLSQPRPVRPAASEG